MLDCAATFTRNKVSGGVVRTDIVSYNFIAQYFRRLDGPDVQPALSESLLQEKETEGENVHGTRGTTSDEF